MNTSPWHQVTVGFPDWNRAENAAVTHLRPRLCTAQTDGLITGWFFIRKAPCWRMRFPSEVDPVQERLGHALDRLASEGHITRWVSGIYEPETVAFGGTAGMDVAHELFTADSRHVLDYLARHTAEVNRPELGRRELGILLPAVMMRAAGQDWYEQGDVWAKVAHHRPTDPATPTPERGADRQAALRRLLTVDAGPSSRLVASGPLAAIVAWIAAFDRAGRQLATLVQRGTLERGLRAVLAHHVIFGWNRLGLSFTEQATMSALARDVVMGEPDHAEAPTAPDNRPAITWQ